MARIFRVATLCIMLFSVLACTTTEGGGKQGAAFENTGKVKYVFMFIGDGMSHVQAHAAQVYLGSNVSGEVRAGQLVFTGFPAAGIASTHDSTSFCPDSASTATAFSCGVKTHSGVLGKKADKTQNVKNVSEYFKEQGRKIGIVSTVTINHATPAAYYAHAASRNDYYDIALQMAESAYDYFGGGAVSAPSGKNKDQKSIYDILKEKGYTVTASAEAFRALNKNSGKIYAQSPIEQDSGSMPYSIDSPAGALTLSDFVKKGIEVLYNDKGFFFMVESGKIDWACHANDAMAVIQDVLELDRAVQSAVDFAKQHPSETLIIVTGDHETGGLTIGQAGTGYNTAFKLLQKQKMSYVAFDNAIVKIKKDNPALTFKQLMPFITENFGLLAPDTPKTAENSDMILTDYEYKKLEAGFNESMLPSAQQKTNLKDTSVFLLYGGYDPISVSLTHILNNKAGIGWTSYAHTGTPVPVFAYGAGSSVFNGSYDNTDLFFKILSVSGIKP